MKTIQHKFVEFAPGELEEGVLYISVQYRSAIHKCVCGCGNRVVTPITPTDWKLIFNGKTVSLYPSIGNWNFECQSHYWIRENCIVHASRWTKREIESNRKKDRKRKRKWFGKRKKETGDGPEFSDRNWPDKRWLFIPILNENRLFGET